MQSEKHLNNAVFIYLFILILIVVINMVKNISILDVVYLVALICSVFKYYLILQEDRK